MSFHHQSYPRGGPHQTPHGTSFTPLPLQYRPTHPHQIAAPTAPQYVGYPYTTPQSNPMSSETLPRSSPAAVATYSRLMTGQFVQQPAPLNSPNQREEFTGSITVMVPALLVLVVIGINGENIRRIQQNSGVIRIHIHDPPPGVECSDMVLPRRCQIWGIEEATAAAKREIENIISSNRMSPLDTRDVHWLRTGYLFDAYFL